MTIRVFVIDEQDNVATNVADEIPKGTKVEVKGTTIETQDVIPYGHKMALQPIPKGGTVLKYALSIGSATVDIQPGNHVHIHNVESNRGRGDLA
ncbi:MAG: D-galactarate dehydratase [Chloroflexi bacterium]|nr:MAG: D-galactarate dehydratase [Chloroflexota bacterium]